MKTQTAFLLLAALLPAGPASATRARDYIDAEHRGYISLPAEQVTAAITLAQPLDATPPAANAGAEQLPPPQQAKPEAPPPVVSTVPEPSGFAMLACGLLLLLLAPFGRESEAITPERPHL
jgi:hypothetical protein